MKYFIYNEQAYTAKELKELAQLIRNDQPEKFEKFVFEWDEVLHNGSALGLYNTIKRIGFEAFQQTLIKKFAGVIEDYIDLGILNEMKSGLKKLGVVVRGLTPPPTKEMR